MGSSRCSSIPLIVVSPLRLSSIHVAGTDMATADFYDDKHNIVLGGSWGDAPAYCWPQDIVSQ